MVKEGLGRQKYCVSLRSKEKKHVCSFWLVDSNSSLSFHYAIFQYLLVVFLFKGGCQLFFLRFTPLIHPSYSSFRSTSPNILILLYLWISFFFSVSTEARFKKFFLFRLPLLTVIFLIDNAEVTQAIQNSVPIVMRG